MPISNLKSISLNAVRESTVFKFLLIALSTLTVYMVTRGPYVYQNHFVYLAEAFINGRLGLINPPASLAELVFHKGYYYVVYPPMPAVLLIPFVAVFGSSLDQAALSIILGSLSVACIWLMLVKTGVTTKKSLWLSLLFGFGTCFWYTSSVGSSWYIAHVSAVLFLTLAIVESFGSQRNFVIGLLLGFAYISRLPTVLALPFFLLLTFDKEDQWGKRFRNIILLLLGLAIPAGMNALYNYLRYSTLFDVGYFLIPGVLEEPWYRYGIFDVRYIPRHLYAILLQGPLLLDDFPYFKPSWMGLGLFFTTPAFFYIFKGSWKKISKFAAITVLCILPPLISHGTVGFAQFGYRFSLDFVPFLMLLVAKGMKEELGWCEKGLIAISILINMWGVISINMFGFVSYF